MDIKEFLRQFTSEELTNKGILRGNDNRLNNESIQPLIELMKEEGIEKLDYPNAKWYFDINGNFKNPKSKEKIKEGKIDDLGNEGEVFTGQNTTINPFYRNREIDDDNGNNGKDDEDLTFQLERDLQNALKKNIEQIEQGLKIVDGGSERTVEAGRIDITAKDNNGIFVVIELKAGMSKSKDIAQIASYMTSIREEEKQNDVRGILIAGDFEKRVVLAARIIPNLKLLRYSFSFGFDEM